MDLNASHMFVAVVQAGSLSAAATRLGIPLPTLSRRIRDLERQLKVQLLERSARGAKLTDAGSRLYEHASRGIEALLEGKQAVVTDQARLKGRLRLSLPQTVEPWWELLAAFQRRYPDIQVYIYSTERRVDLIEDGIDVALRVGAIEPKAVLATNDYHHLCSRALGGDVVTELPPFLAAAPIRERRLVPLLPQYALPEWSINLLYPSHRHRSTIVRTYLDFCQSYLPTIIQACEIGVVG